MVDVPQPPPPRPLFESDIVSSLSAGAEDDAALRLEAHPSSSSMTGKSRVACRCLDRHAGKLNKCVRRMGGSTM